MDGYVTGLLEEIRDLLEEIAKNTKPKEYKVEVSAPVITSKAEKTPVTTKEAKRLTRGHTVRFSSEGPWHYVSHVIPLAHGDVWVYDIAGDVVGRVSADRQLEIKV